MTPILEAQCQCMVKDDTTQVESPCQESAVACIRLPGFPNLIRACQAHTDSWMSSQQG